MKKSILFSMAFAAIFSSCSKENGGDNVNNNELVPIQLGVGSEISTEVHKASRASRAPINKWENTEVGLFALGKNADAWDINDPRTDPSVLWNNVKGTINGEAATAVSITIDGAADKYYPKQGTMNYTFYGYYPKNIVTPEVTNDNVTATIKIDGTNDIIWGKAVAPTLNGTTEGYNAAYFRDIKAKTPEIKFGHLLTQLKFQFKREADFESSQVIKVKSITISEQPESLNLLIADRTNDENSGQLTSVGEKNSTIASNIDVPVEVNSTSLVLIGEPVMLFTEGAKTSVYKGIVELEDGTGAVTPVSITVNAPDVKGFEVGKAYTVNLTVGDMESIVVNASLTEWVDGGEIDGGII